ncbi:Hippurate hydrolase OS=Castellaniella defragrans OX=75697 GN=HNR28_001763 PE=4 SV=1 [Castellaniella defragrans]
MKTPLLATLNQWLPDMTRIRHDLHAWPELAFQETRTADTIVRLLNSWDIATDRGLGETGVVGHIQGNRPGRSVGLRADMDALPVTEANTFAHASHNTGVMHACGHDGHTTMLLTAARYLAQHRDFAGTIHVIFQPAEEGGAGAQRMIEDGLFEDFPMEAVFGMHNWPGMPEGSFGLTDGPIMASSSIFEIHVRGRGAHGGMPHLGVDPVVAAAQLILAYQGILTREQDPLDAGVISVTQIRAGSADNVIPDEAVLRGTVRTLTAEALDLIESRMREITQHLSQALRCEAAFDFCREYPATLNHSREAELCAQVLTELVGADRVNTRVRPSMGAEDFSFMLQERPGCYVWIGSGTGDHRADGHGQGPCMLHNSSYDFNDALIPLGAAYWVSLARRYLQEPADPADSAG